MAPTAVRMVLVEGENGDGALVDQDSIDVRAEDAPTFNAADQVISAILGTREGAAEGGYQLASTGVTWRDPAQAAELRDALAGRKIENVMLVSAFLAAAALAHSVGNETNYAQTALLFIEPETATLAVVNSADGSVADIQTQPLPADDDAAVARLAELVSTAETLQTNPDAVFVVGSGVDVPMIKPALEAATTLPVTLPEEPETALAWGSGAGACGTCTGTCGACTGTCGAWGAGTCAGTCSGAGAGACGAGAGPCSGTGAGAGACGAGAGACGAGLGTTRACPGSGRVLEVLRMLTASDTTSDATPTTKIDSNALPSSPNGRRPSAFGSSCSGSTAL
ncbi:DUF7159 family protein [Mycobacterium gordonae]|uniref:DUF7159 family protein n=1 Tax=Mycobacterium gordonae TaxID=1778 RepID=UPI003F515038